MTVKFGPDLTYFLWSLATGLMFAIIYDLLKVTRRVANLPDFVVVIGDMLFMLFVGIVAVAESYLVNNGELRVYSLICYVLIFVLYRFVVGDRLVKFFSSVCEFIIKVIVKLALIVLVPVKILCKAVVAVGKRMLRIKDFFYSKIHIKK